MTYAFCYHFQRVKINLLLNSQGLSLGMRTPPGILTTDADYVANAADA